MKEFEILKNETSELIENNLCNNEKEVIIFLNTILSKFGSNLTVRKNLSIASFRNLLCNSESPDVFKEYLNRLDVKKEYEIETAEGYKESIEFNSDITEPTYEIMQKFLNSAIKFSENIIVMEYI